MTQPVKVLRFVSMDEEHNYLGRDALKDEMFYTFDKNTYGCVDELDGIALSEMEGEYPFFEFPRDAIEVVE